MSAGLLDCLKDHIDCVLGVRDSIGAVLHNVYLLTRTWTGKKPGEGTATDAVLQVLPSPYIVDYSHSLRLLEGGTYRQGDIMLKDISKNKYPNEAMIDCSTADKHIEKFYLIDDRIYTVINVKEGYLTWDVQIRKYSNQTRYGG